MLILLRQGGNKVEVSGRTSECGAEESRVRKR